VTRLTTEAVASLLGVRPSTVHESKEPAMRTAVKHRFQPHRSDAAVPTLICRTCKGFYDDPSHLELSFADCECYHDCRSCSQSGDWHVHAGEPCPVHPDAPGDR
jgi:hypothetical protein